MVKKENFPLPMRQGSSDELTLAPSNMGINDDVAVSIHPIPTRDGVIVSIQPPEKPGDPKLHHISCDIALVIDVSGSMQQPAPAKMNGDDGQLSSENFGLSILDMVKHAARTILSTLDEGDRLGIVTFSRDATVIQKLLSMTPNNKKLTEMNIEAMAPDSITNLWHGIQKGISLFDGEEDTGRVPAVMILTDGLPNYMCPAQGYIPKIRGTWEALPATLHTFGFGYEIRSGLLKSIAEIGGGNYAFIPDAGMIGTVFVHAVAHLQTTYATKCSLQITTPKTIHLKATAGKTIEQQEQDAADYRTLTIRLGNLQYGQSRDIFLTNFESRGSKATFSPATGGTVVSATLNFSQMRTVEFSSFDIKDVLQVSDLPEHVIAYHRSRSMLCDFLSSFFPLQSDGEYETRRAINPQRHQEDFKYLLDKIPARLYNDKYNKSLMEDIVGNLPSGQVSLALSSEGYFNRWGCHYFLSLWNAHAKQLCNSFKDPGPLMYNQNPFFAKCRDALDQSFDTIPPPKPSCPTVATTSHINMRFLNARSGPCFAGTSEVTLASGKRVPIRKLRRGSRVHTPVGSRRVAAVLKTIVRGAIMCKIGDLVVTPWHPIRIGHTGKEPEWNFPANVVLTSEQPRVVLYSGPIYSILLQADRNVDAHILEVGGVWAVALGHGVVRGSDIRAHRFLGDYGKVARAIARLQPGKDGVALSHGVRRRDKDGLICGFKKYLPSRHPERTNKSGTC
ncbi:hint-domain-containing protein [Hypoxylon sp. FL0890]|nr:hint-domain-containing protein [Hypoxylon sp. FL0890]